MAIGKFLDAFKKPLAMGDRVIYSPGRRPDIEYVIAKVVELIPCKPDKSKSFYPPDRVRLRVLVHNSIVNYGTQPLVNASNVVKLSEICDT
jgi:hypothetical protein